MIRQLNPNLSVDDFETFLTQSASTFLDPATGGTYRTVDVNALADLVSGSTSSAPTTPPTGSDDHPNTVGSNTPVVAGTTVTGELEIGGDKDVFALSVEAGATYQIDLRGAPSSLGTLSDPLVRIIDSNGASLAEDDDSGTGLESKLEYTAVSSGTVYIEAGAFSSRQTGTYQIDVVSASSSDDQPNAIGNNSSLTIGSVQTGDIEEVGDVDVFSLSVDAGTTYTIDQKGFFSSVGTLQDTLLTLRDGNGSILAQNDDGGFRLESQISYVAANTGIVYVEADAFGSNTGTYEISVGSSSNSGDQANGPGAGLTVISPGTPITGDLEVGGDKDVFSLSLAAGATYQIDLRGSTSGLGTLTDPLLRILDADSQVLAENDDGGQGLESSISFTATTGGEVFVEAGAFSTSQTGTYQVDVAQTSVSTRSLGDLIGQTLEHAPITPMDTIFGGAIDFQNDRDMYQFILEAGVTYQFDVRGSNSSHGTLWDPQAFLYNSDGVIVGQDDDSGTAFDASIAYTAPTSGSYYLDVISNMGLLAQSAGTYSVETDIIL